MEKHIAKIFTENTAEEIAAVIRSSGEWNYDYCEALCYKADMEDEWKDSDGENFEDIIEAAAKKLGVEIY